MINQVKIYVYQDIDTDNLDSYFIQLRFDDQPVLSLYDICVNAIRFTLLYHDINEDNSYTYESSFGYSTEDVLEFLNSI